MPPFAPNPLLRLVKFLLSMSFWLLRSLVDGLTRVLGSRRPGHATGIYYHQVLPEQRDRFARQMDHLLRWAVPISADHRAPLPPGRRYAMVTADDGWTSFVENALPELKQRRIPVAIFVISDCMGEHLGGQRDRIVSETELRALQPDIAAGLVMIGSHTCSHRRLVATGRREALRELIDSRERLKQVLGQEVVLFCFPFGVHTPQTLALCRMAGYQRAFDGMPARALEDPCEFLIGRVRVDPDDWMIEFHLKLVGAYDWVPWAAELKRRIFLALRVRRAPQARATVTRAAPGSDARRQIGTSLKMARSSSR
ncbi:MAG TPA: polysaccharide deacetylase family protein [Candidatus Binataceae bacterium]|nr:polysaccharide deacetylase family protein [Candidatus Binataceae bacterium]